MALVEITKVRKGALPEDVGGRLDVPEPGDKSESYGIDVRGWALGERVPVKRVDVYSPGIAPWELPLNHQRPDIAQSHADIPGAGECGFYGPINTLRMGTDFRFSVTAVLEDDSRAQIAGVEGRRVPLETDFEPAIQPLMVTTLGRSGSTIFMRVLGGHPKILSYGPPEFDPRIATYWSDVLKTLTEPSSYLRQIVPPFEPDPRRWWLGDEDLHPRDARRVKVRDWLGSRSPRRIATFCQSMIEDVYSELAPLCGREGATYFAEKYWSPSAPTLLWELYPRAKEVFLVRDFRDLVCSIFAFEERRGTRVFGRSRFEADAEWITRTVKGWGSELVRAYRSRSDLAHVLRYEDLVTRPTETLGDLLDYLELDSSEDSIDRMVRRLTETTPAMEAQKTTPSAAASIGRWQRDLSPELQATLEEVLGPALEQFGYAPATAAGARA